MPYLFIAIYILIILVVIEICTTLFVLTGLDKHIARFQVISILTGTGFTTGESELIIEHPIRRRLGSFLILFGVFSLAVIISAISGILSKSFHVGEIGFAAGGLVFLLALLKIPVLQKRLSKRLHKQLERNFSLEELPIKDVFLQNDDDHFAEIDIHEDSRFIGKTLKDAIKADEDINVMFIRRGDIIIRHKRHEEKINEGDRILLYGDKDTLKEKFAEEIKAQEGKNKEQLKAMSKLPQ